jgi:uncharacterized damage-inducible protein DinB
MQKFFEDYINRLEDLHTQIRQAIAGLSPQALSLHSGQALDWIPGEGMNSINVLVVHLCGAERYWIGDVVGGDLSGRERATEFLTHGLDETALNERLDQVLAHSKGVLSRLTLQDLDRVCTSPRDGHTFTVGWALLHALEHTAIHLGHIQVTRQLCEGKHSPQP